MAAVHKNLGMTGEDGAWRCKCGSEFASRQEIFDHIDDAITANESAGRNYNGMGAYGC
jgi:hypothetical protein